MKCLVCGAALKRLDADLPFKVTERTIVILKNLPVLRCGNCTEYSIEDEVIRSVEEILAGVDGAAELEVIRFPA